MNLEFTEEEKAFRAEVREFIENNYPQNIGTRGVQDEMSREDMLAWHKILGKKGWSVPAWPKEYGGTDWTPTQRYIWSEENARKNTVMPLPFGVAMVGPVIYTFGNEEQKAQHLPGIRSGDVWWCQGYSEPGAGSDLASLKTSAVRDGDDYILNGQKTWTTLAQHADWGFFLCRTDPDAPKPQMGISFILVDMNTPGIEVRPIKLIDGGYEVNEVWLTDVRVPATNLIGEENKGWTYAKFLLAHERSGIAGVARSKRGVEQLKEIAASEMLDGKPLIEDMGFATKISQLEIDLSALEITELRTLAGEQAGKGPGPESSLLKVKGTEIQQRLTELTLEAVGYYGAPDFRSFPDDGSNDFPIGPDYAHHAAPTYFNMRKTSIYGGSNEIQRNIITKMILGL
ncbi:MAG: pimeloyl-CoA dehydrogenase large subunit [Sphingomonadales bacterium]|nr:pimeloyl-CoA dehydrogenase large subunit [Sphingomonadales bacterium]PIX66397.1 MAG: pimeloyl-CoA dehydrogenase large subunit [Sphingomonadales bacterium CG_4_10_14_3_um_filter_58_15]NCO99824.1 pimeloyl-CoA dehydrogenase large subunit [Sphingomonadales bacterium]NCP28124.1 pimeloyl-CoA dehydrogenase large subunit [Sphingomonadales bacterium]NCP42356.1 pimeloyl-CoA dehydrogenase large subunit [Sphingomonadales bacterium]